MSNYKRGAIKERTTLKKLLDMGCTYACRVAGSRSQFDAVGAWNPYTIYVQVKSTLNPPKKILSILNKYRNDWLAMDDVQLAKRSTKELWIYKPRARQPIKIGIVDVQFYIRV